MIAMIAFAIASSIPVPSKTPTIAPAANSVAGNDQGCRSVLLDQLVLSLLVPGS